MVTCGLGVCSQAVEKACVEGVLEVCTDEDILSSAQASDDATCDGLDNDCNGETDEDFAPQTTSCGEGACAASGTQSCVEVRLSIAASQAMRPSRTRAVTGSMMTAMARPMRMSASRQAAARAAQSLPRHAKTE